MSPQRPTTDVEKDEGFRLLPTRFENLAATGFSRDDVNSPRDINYNCIAFAAGFENKFWWPDLTIPEHYWPVPVRNNIDVTVENFIRTFQIFKFEPCATSDHEPGFEKVALFVDSNNSPLHMARDDGDGVWKSKAGVGFDFWHYQLRGVEGRAYGVARYFMRRNINDFAKWITAMTDLLRLIQMIGNRNSTTSQEPS